MRWFIIAFLSIFILVGLGVFGTGIWMVAGSSATSSWPVVNGTILQSDFVVDRQTSDEFWTRAEIRYRYSVAGKEYESDQLDQSLSDHSPPGEARRWTNDYPVDATVDVYVNPESPDDAVLRPGIPVESWFFIAFGAAFTVVPILICVAVLRAIRNFHGGHNVSDRNRNPAFTFVFVALFFGIFLLVGLGCLSYGISNWQAEAASVDWPAAEGVVIHSGIEVHRDTSSEGPRRDTYSPYVVYDYVIDGVTYTASGIEFSDVSSSNRRDAIQAANKYKKGKAVSVFYDPEDPYVATLVTGRSGGTLILVILGGVFTLVGGIPIVWIALSRIKKAAGLTTDGDRFDGRGFDDGFDRRDDRFDSNRFDADDDEDRSRDGW